MGKNGNDKRLQISLRRTLSGACASTWGLRMRRVISHLKIMSLCKYFLEIKLGYP
jgi:hypothetical protein